MKSEEIRHVVDVWVDQYQDLASKPYIQYVQIFENRGAIMGCSNPHPHGQIWCNSSLPTLPSAEDGRQREYFEQYHRRLLDDYLAEELRRQDRLIFENDHFAVLVPFWAVWPFESIVLPKVSSPDMTGLQGRERDALAETLQRLGVRYDNLFQTSFPYSMGIHQKPTDSARRDYWGWHIHYFPPLLRSAAVKKFMVGYEMLAMPQRDITPEQSAERLRACSERHYLTRESTS
jgi:UDPglucose--hexose-1-phosphate uridylyltransferase